MTTDFGMATHRHVALYGNVAIARARCEQCMIQAFVLDGVLQCCGRMVDEYQPEVYKRESEPEYARRLPRKADRDAQLLEQDYSCFYCGAMFGERIQRITSKGGTRLVLVRVEWDHFVPFSYSQDNRTRNFVASCSICNRLKSNICFQTVDAARIQLRDVRTRKGYENFDTS
jgi:5-methylcytosine-specific restriction endonuclease McrA